MTKQKIAPKNKILTIPNLLSCFRIALIPLIIHQYCIKKQYRISALILLLSGITDVVDGFIARHFDMVSNLGKALDPIADKLTQIALLFCLATRFPLMLLPFTVLVAKEVFSGILGILMIRKTNTVPYAKWHGKLSTVFLYAILFVHMVWHTIPGSVSTVLIIASVLLMFLSALLYALWEIKLILVKS